MLGDKGSLSPLWSITIWMTICIGPIYLFDGNKRLISAEVEMSVFSPASAKRKQAPNDNPHDACCMAVLQEHGQSIGLRANVEQHVQDP